MTKKKSSDGRSPPNNPVAKYAAQFQRAAVFRERTRYSRKAKHKQSEPFATGSRELMAKGFVVSNYLPMKRPILPIPSANRSSGLV